MPVFLISLVDQDARRAELLNRSVPTDWVKSFFHATDMRGLQIDRLDHLADIAALENRIGRLPLAAEIGCALSHRAAAHWLHRSAYDIALVLEDDVVPLYHSWLANVIHTANALNSHAKAGAAFICLLGARHDQTDLALRRRVILRGAEAPEGTPDLYLHTDPEKALWRAHAYLISRGAAERTVKQEFRVATLADDWQLRQRSGLLDDIFYTRPVLLAQDENRPSTIRSSAKTITAIHHSQKSTIFRVAGAFRKGIFLSKLFSSLNYRWSFFVARLRSKFPYYLNIQKLD